MFTRKNSTDNVKQPKAPKAKKNKKVDSSEFSNDDSFTPVVTKKAKKPHAKAPKDVYTLVLLLSFLFFVAATVFLYLDLGSYK